MTASTFTTANAANLNAVLHGNCVEVMRGIKSESVDFVLTDPPYRPEVTERAFLTHKRTDREHDGAIAEKIRQK
jgi:DNA modification methylase